MATVVKLRGVDVTAAVVEGSVEPGIHDLFAHTRLAKCKLKTSTPQIPEADDYLFISKTDGTSAAFAGLAKMPDTLRTPNIRTGLEYDVTAQGWEALLDTIMITADLVIAANSVDAAVLSTVLSTYYGPIATSVTHVLYPSRTDLQYTIIPASTMSLRRFIDWLAGQAGGVPWWISQSDKAVHYNDPDQAAPFILSDAPNGTTKRGFQYLTRTRDSQGRRTRITVGDGAGNTYTATDDEQSQALTAKMTDEPGAPSTRNPTAMTVIDSKLLTASDLQRAAFSMLRQQKDRTILTALTYDEGLEIGQYVDVQDSQYGVLNGDGAPVGPHPFLEAQELTVTSATEDLDIEMNRYLITKVTPVSVGRDVWNYVIQMGDPQSVFAALLAQGQR